MMERDMSEILSSQHSMLTHQSKKGADLSDEKLGEMYNQQLQRIKSVLAKRPKTNVLYNNHSECIKNPQKSAHKVNVFFDEKLKESAMADVVDSSLYHHRQDKAVLPVFL